MIASQLEAPEVNLYYTVRGSGPMLLIFQGGAGNADGSENCRWVRPGRSRSCIMPPYPRLGRTGNEGVRKNSPAGDRSLEKTRQCLPSPRPAVRRFHLTS